MTFGLSAIQTQILQSIFKKSLNTGLVIIYGSRVKNTYTKYSDIDLVLKNTQLSIHQVEDLIDTITESDFPYLCDIQLFENINNPSLLEHIDRMGEVFYREEKKLPKGWEVKKLGEVCILQRGLTYSRKDTADYSNNIVLRATNINLESSRLNFSELKYLRNDFKIQERYKLKKGSLLICFSSGSKAHLGKVALIENDYNYSFGGFIGQISPSKKILSEYLFYSMVSGNYKTYIFELNDGVGINNLKIKDLQEYEIPLPPLPEQKRIVAILDRAFKAIDQAKINTEQNLQNAKELFASYLQNIFENKGDDWEIKKLNEISENLDNKRIPITKRDRKKGSIPYYGASGVVDYVEDYIFNEDLLCISEDGANLLARTYPISFSVSGKIWVNNHVHILRFDNMITQIFIEQYLNSIKLDEFISGMAQPKLNQTQLNKIPIPLPPIHEQKQIVKKLNTLQTKTKKLETLYQQKIVDLEELKKSILQKAFNGEL